MGQGLTWAERLTLWAYGLVMRALQPLLRRKLRRRGQQEPGYLDHMPQRFGFYEGVAPEPGRIWVHAVSLGETRAAAILIEALRAVWPGMRLLLTHSTATGWAQGQALLRPGDAQAWLLEHLHDHRAGDHELDQIVEERPLAVLGIESARLVSAHANHAGSDNAQTVLLETRIDLADEIAGNRIGLDNREGALKSHRLLRTYLIKTHLSH